MVPETEKEIKVLQKMKDNSFFPTNNLPLLVSPLGSKLGNGDYRNGEKIY